ncbi:hypothetical protein MWU57_05755 [Isoptericola sp. S6320L]|uniref:hypothetical protein n=1 Tax=Isoptericola sp. S6320L TaxID=2926411 RepID=UPI001FF10E0D|nr:hypothetical protein [Isoptericola sp. S6320L]MCK0116529.1 hypothetical protein [Isoptericola sp. S6320L]
MARADRTRQSLPGRLLRRTTTAALALALGLGGLLVAPAAVVPAAAANGITEESHARFVVQGKGRVTAEVTTTITNVTPDRGNTYYYWDSYGIGVPASAKNVRATSGGSSLTVSFQAEPEDPNVQWATARFAPLRYGRSRTIVWTYEIGGAPIRSDRWTRVGPGYGTFAAQATGDPGSVSVEVVVPKAMTFDATADFTPDQRGKKTVYTLDEATDEWGVWAAVSVRDPAKTEEKQVTVGDAALTLQSFPGDKTWRKFAADRVTVGLPVLESFLGEPWPGRIEVIREDVSPQVLGYAWFDDVGDEIVLGEELDEATLFHELGHAWFDDGRFEGRWLYEGLTETTAYRVIDAVDGEGEPRPAPSRRSKVAVPLVDWSETERDPATETYAYAAAYTAVHRLLGDLDDETFTAVVSAAYAGEGAYEEAGSTRNNHGRVDWQRFLDLVAERGGVDGTRAYEKWVVDGDGADLLAERADARDAYVELDESDGAWQVPLGLRRDMTNWNFDQAADEVGTLKALAPEAVAVQEAAETTGLGVPDTVRAAYEDAETPAEYEELGSLLPQAVTTMEQVSRASTAVAAESDPVTELGESLLDADATAAGSRAALADGELDRAAALAEETTAQADRALWIGLAVIVGGLLLLALVVLVPVLLVRRRRRRRAAGLTAPQVVAVIPAPGAAPDGTMPEDATQDAADGGTDDAKAPVGG